MSEIDYSDLDPKLKWWQRALYVLLAAVLLAGGAMVSPPMPDSHPVLCGLSIGGGLMILYSALVRGEHPI